jgi:hypothetical protein
MTPRPPTPAAVVRILAAGNPRAPRVREVEVRPSTYATSFAIYDVDVTFADGSTTMLVAKQLDRAALTDAARAAKPEVLYDASREPRVYETLLHRACSGTPAFYGAEDGLLLIERIDGPLLSHVGEVDVWCTVARWLGEFNARFRSLESGAASAATLVRYERRFLQLWLERARTFAPRGALDGIARAHDAAVELLVSAPRTLVHGEFYPSNVLIASGRAGIRVAPVDWETAGYGPGLIDLAALLTGWSADTAAALENAYREGARVRLDGTFREILRSCRLHLAVRWLGWSPTWSPPREHRYDWLGEALRVAEELGT